MPSAPKFTVNAKQFLLTWPKCTLSKEEVLLQLQVLHEITSYTISEEKHSDGTPHVHAVLVLSKKLHTTNARCFDLGLWHSNIKVLKSKADVDKARSYVSKDGKFITNFQETLGKRTQLAKALIDYGKIDKVFITNNPEVIFLNYSSVTSWLRFFKKPIEKATPPMKRRHLWVTGPSNCGKTHWLRAYLSLCDNPCEIPHNNDFVEASETTDVLYCDEYKGHLTVQFLNRLCDGDTQLNVKGGSTRIQFPTVIICSNYPIRDCYPKIEDKIYDTLINRFNEYDLSINRPPLPKFIIKN